MAPTQVKGQFERRTQKSECRSQKLRLQHSAFCILHSAFRAGALYTRSGRRKEAEALLRRTEREAATRYVPPFTFFALYAGLGDYEQAFAALDRAFEERSGFITVLEVLPTLDPIREDPRFRERIERLRQRK